MKAKIYFLSLMITAIAMCMVSCGYDNNVTPDLEKGIINAIYQSLDLTPEQFAAAMSKQGLHEMQQPNFMENKRKTFSNEIQRSPNAIIIHVLYKDDIISGVSYERSLNTESNIEAYYRLFSDRIAEHGYEDWSGYYDDPDENHNISRIVHGNDDYSLAQVVEERNELCGLIVNDHMLDTITTQYFAESFIHTGSIGSKWKGQILMWGDIYTAQEGEIDGEKEEEYEEKKQKYIFISFILKRLK